MEQLFIPGGLRVRDTLTCGQFQAPADSIDNEAIIDGAGIDASKVVHRHAVRYTQKVGTAVVAETDGIHIARASGVIRDIEAAIIGAVATDASRTVTIDVKKSTGEGAYATILSSTLVFTNTSVLRRVYAALINDGNFIAGDHFEIVVTVAGGVGTQAQGLLVTFTIEEAPE